MYQHWTKRLVFTSGIHALAEEHGAFWLIDVVASHNGHNARLRQEEFQLWRLRLNGKGGCTVSAHRDSGEPAIVSQDIEYTDYPENFEWYVVLGEAWTMMQKSEY